MSAKRRRTPRDARRWSLGQNFLVDRTEVGRLVDAIDVHPGELIIEIGAGTGALTLPLVQAGASVIAIESDPNWARQLDEKVREIGLIDQVEIVCRDFRVTEWQSEKYRVVSSPPFGLTTALFARLFDNPAEGPLRADLLIQYEVARKRAANPPTTLRSASWAPWWTFELGPVVPRMAFRPIPRVDAAFSSFGAAIRPYFPNGWHRSCEKCYGQPGIRDLAELIHTDQVIRSDFAQTETTQGRHLGARFRVSRPRPVASGERSS